MIDLEKKWDTEDQFPKIDYSPIFEDNHFVPINSSIFHMNLHYSESFSKIYYTDGEYIKMTKEKEFDVNLIKRSFAYSVSHEALASAGSEVLPILHKYFYQQVEQDVKKSAAQLRKGFQIISNNKDIEPPAILYINPNNNIYESMDTWIKTYSVSYWIGAWTLED